jgi:hypothetical protein
LTRASDTTRMRLSSDKVHLGEPDEVFQLVGIDRNAMFGEQPGIFRALHCLPSPHSGRTHQQPYISKGASITLGASGPRSNVQFTGDFNRNTSGYSPDRVDALVWALTSLSEPDPPEFAFA